MWTSRKRSVHPRWLGRCILAVWLIFSVVWAGGQEGGEGTAQAAMPATTEDFRGWYDLPYAHTSPRQKLDLYLPRTAAGPFPVIVWVHGGAWLEGDKGLPPNGTQIRVLPRGYALASVNYRLSGEAKFPAQIHDVKAAVRWLRGNAKAYQLDPGRIGAWGRSAGGHLVALLGTSGGVAELEDLGLGNAEQSSRVQAVVVWFAPVDLLRMEEHASARGCAPYGGVGHSAPSSPASRLFGFPVTEQPERVQTGNPVRYVRSDAPPFFIQHGERDCTVAPQQSQLLYDALRPVLSREDLTLMYLPAGHGGRPFSAGSNIRLILDFLDKHLKK